MESEGRERGERGGREEGTRGEGASERGRTESGTKERRWEPDEAVRFMYCTPTPTPAPRTQFSASGFDQERRVQARVAIQSKDLRCRGGGWWKVERSRGGGGKRRRGRREGGSKGARRERKPWRAAAVPCSMSLSLIHISEPTRPRLI
eukprot:3248372-Rhodomonas_salina.2